MGTVSSEALKKKLKLRVKKLPVNSPDLNPCDFFLHPLLAKKLSAWYEKLDKKKISKAIWLRKVQTIAKGISKKEAKAALAGGMKNRLEEVRKAKGWHLRR
jgi:hypothetical protein